MNNDVEYFWLCGCFDGSFGILVWLCRCFDGSLEYSYLLVQYYVVLINLILVLIIWITSCMVAALYLK